MRIVLQNTSTSLYLSKIGWTASFKEARDFGRVHHAVDYCTEHNISDVQVVVVVEHEHGGLEFIPSQLEALMHNEANPEIQPYL